MIRKELYRLMIKEKLLLAVAIMLVIKVFTCMDLEYAYPWKSDSETEFYNEYMRCIAGELTDAKIEQIESDYQNEALRGNHYDAMALIYSDYQYVLQDTDRHYFLTPNAFGLALICLDTDWLLIFLILLMAASIVTKEYTAGVIQITQTSRKGRSVLAMQKAGIMVGAVAVIACICQALPLLVLGMKYGFSCADAPIQSISQFESFSRELSLIEAWGYVSVLRVIAYTIFAMLIFSLASVCRKATTLFFAGIGMVFFPVYLLTGETHGEKLYQTLIPLGSLNGIGFLLGDSQPIVGTEYRFMELSIYEVVCICMAQLLVALLATALAVLKLSGAKWNRKRLRYIPTGAVMLSLTVVCGTFAGCSSESTDVIKAITMNGREMVTERYIWIDEYTYYDKIARSICPIAESVIDGEKILAIGDRTILVARKEINGSLRNDFTIELLDPETGERKPLIRFGRNADQDAFLSIDRVIDLDFLFEADEATANMGINESVVYEKGCVYFAYNDVVVKADTASGAYSVVYYASEMTNTTISDGMIYYTSGVGELVRCDMQTQTVRVLYEAVQDYWLGEGRLYLTFSDREGLYVAPIDDTPAEPIRLSDLTPETLDEYGDTVVYEQGGKIAYVDMKASDDGEHFIETSGYLAGIHGDCIYTYDYADGELTIEAYSTAPDG